jgi:hypothetical protein
VKVHALYEWPFGTSLGLAWFGSSGIPRTREATFDEAGPVMYRGRNSDGRLPFWTQLDLYLRHELRLGLRYSLALSANIANLLNQRATTNYHPYELFPGQFIAVDQEGFFFNGVDTSRLIEEQQLARDARFLLDSGFQAPRTVRLGITLSF